MSDDDLKIRLLEICGGRVDEAMKAFDWLSSKAVPANTSPSPYPHQSDKVEQSEWGWWTSSDGEGYSGPHASRQEAIDEGVESEYGDNGKFYEFFIVEARQKPLKITELVDVDYLIERAEDGGAWEEFVDYDGEVGITQNVTTEQWDDLAARLQKACDEWHANNKIVFRSWAFADQRNEETVTVPIEPDPSASGNPEGEGRENQERIETENDCLDSQGAGETSSPGYPSQQDKAEQEIPEGFKFWEGGECPLDDETLVEVALKDWVGPPRFLTVKAGNIIGGINPDCWRGNRFENAAPIIAYRIIKPAREDEGTTTASGRTCSRCAFQQYYELKHYSLCYNTKNLTAPDENGERSLLRVGPGDTCEHFEAEKTFEQLAGAVTSTDEGKAEGDAERSAERIETIIRPEDLDHLGEQAEVYSAEHEAKEKADA